MSPIISPQRRGSLQRQLIVWIVATLIILTIIALSFDYITQKRILTSNFYASMNQAANHILLALERSPTMNAATDTLREYCNVMSGHDDPNHEISLINQNGNVVVSSKEKPPSDNVGMTIPDQLTWSAMQKNGNSYTTLTLPFETKWANTDFQGAIYYVENNDTIHSLLSRLFWNRTLSLLIIIIVLSLITLWILKSKVLSPLDQIFVQSYAVSTGDYETWDVVDPGNEIGDIQRMLNFMVEKIKKHEKELVKKERHSAISETIARTYYSIITRISTIQNTCDNIRGQHKNENHVNEKLSAGIIKNECKAMLNDLSNLTDMFDDENEQTDLIEDKKEQSNE